MDRLYTKIFEQVRMPEESARRMRAELAHRFEQAENKEVAKMNKKAAFRRPRMAVIAAAVVCALSVSAFAAGGLAKVYTMMTGGVATTGDENGTAGTMDIAETRSPIETRDGGRVYFVANGEEIDITGEFSYEKPYIYECATEDGARHLFTVGGRAGEEGWSEFILDEDGMPVGGQAQFGTSGGSDDAPWLDAGKEQLGLPW